MMNGPEHAIARGFPLPRSHAFPLESIPPDGSFPCGDTYRGSASPTSGERALSFPLASTAETEYR